MQNNAYEVDANYLVQHGRQTMGCMFLSIALVYCFKTQILRKYAMRHTEKCLHLHLQLLNNNFTYRACQIMPMKYTLVAQHESQAAGDVLLVYFYYPCFLFYNVNIR